MNSLLMVCFFLICFLRQVIKWYKNPNGSHFLKEVGLLISNRRHDMQVAIEIDSYLLQLSTWKIC